MASSGTIAVALHPANVMRPSRSQYPGVIQAAGLSTRMGVLGPKALLPYRGRPLLDHIVRTALASRLAEVIVVLGHEADRVRRVLGEDARVRAVVNGDYALGRSTSIRAGLAAAGAAAPGALFLLGDQPLMTVDLIDAVIGAAEAEEARGPAGASLVVAAFAAAADTAAGVSSHAGGDANAGADAGVAANTTANMKGNPVLFRRSLFEKLDALRGDRGALDLIGSLWDCAARVPIEDAATQTRIETPDDYERLLAGEAGGRR